MPVLSTRAARPHPLARTAALGLALLVASGWASAGTASPPPSPFSGLSSSHTYTPATGEALGRIVSKTLPNSPLSAEILAQAFVSLNPQSFTDGASSRTLSTATLKVPNHNQLVQLVLAKNEAARPAVLAAVAAQETLAKAALLPSSLRLTEKRENWVRYAGGPVNATLNFDGSADERKGWIRYLGAAVQRAFGATGLGTDALRWVHYPRMTIANEATALVPAAVLGAVALPESSVDTRNWVRYTAGRSFPKQHFAQLFD